jgi:protein-tyrosine phosphatase
MTVSETPTLVDIHSHLVPGVDDGARHLPGVLNAIERMSQVGIGRFITTPHIDASLALTPSRLAARLDEVTQAWQTAHDAIQEEFPEVEYHRGHEVLIDLPEPDLTDPRLRLAGTSFVLIEWPRLQVPQDGIGSSVERGGCLASGELRFAGRAVWIRRSSSRLAPDRGGTG